MIPVISKDVKKQQDILLNKINEDTSNDKTYFVNYKDAYIDGLTKDKKALMQSIYFMLTTERYQYPIYSRNYGIFLDNLIGQPFNIVKAELKRRITNCLKTDNRIASVDSFSFQRDGKKLMVTFVVHTKEFGELKIEKGYEF